MTRYLLIVFAFIIYLSCGPSSPHSKKDLTDPAQRTEHNAKFEPPEGECILFVGQELTAIGGLDEYSNGYMDFFPTPGGITMYTKIRPGDSEFGFTYDGLAGLQTTDNWGDGPSNMSLQMADPNFANVALAIGLEIVNHEAEIANGEQDSLVLALGEWISSLGRRPVFLRIGYEFGGEWNHYDRDKYKKAFRYIKRTYDGMGIENVAYVWQSHGWGMSQADLLSWYPGDDVVDWCGFSFFSRWAEVEMIDFARKHNKPVFIAEATPTISTATTNTDGRTKQTLLSNPEQAIEAWDDWFVPLFRMINENKDVIKAVSYINCNWKANPMWQNNPTFQQIDARLQLNPDLAKKWVEETSQSQYLKASPGFWDYLWNN